MVTARFREEGSVLHGTQDGACEGFSIQLSLDGEEAVEEIAALVRLAHKMYFTEDALTRIINVEASHLFSGSETARSLVYSTKITSPSGYVMWPSSTKWSYTPGAKRSPPTPIEGEFTKSSERTTWI